MADNITTPATGTGDATPKVATDQIPGTLEHYQKFKLADGTADSTTMAVVGSTGLQVASVAASQADGHSATLGSTTDAAATTTGSVIAQLRRIANLLAGTLGISGTVTANAGTGTLATSSAAASQADGHSASIGSTTDAAATTTGSVIAQLRRIANLVAGTLSISGAVSQSGTWTVQPGNTANTTAWKTDGSAVTQPVSVAVPTAGGYTISRVLSAATTNATSVKASAGQVYGWYLFNTSAATKFVKLYNKASAPTVGTDTPVMTIPVPAGGGATVEFENGIAFATGIALAITGAVTDADTTAVALNDVICNLLYK